MRNIPFFMLFLLLSAISQAQTGSDISGTVKDNRNEPVAGATITIIHAADSSVIGTGLSNENGKFMFPAIPAGKYMLVVAASGHRKFSGMPFTVPGGTAGLNLPAVILPPSQATTLGEVVVKARKPLIEQEIDKTIVNVGSMLSSATSNTLEVLEKTPGITVDGAGNISLNGRSGVLVMIDGRTNFMSGADLAAYLKSIPGSLLDKIELIDNPSARYDATGNGILNIRLKKNRTAGYMGTLSSGFSQGRYARNNQSASLTYNRKKLSVFTSAGVAGDKNFSDDRYNRSFYGSGSQPVSSVQLRNYQQNSGTGLNANLGLDYNLTASTTIGAQLNWNRGTRNGLLDYTSMSFNAHGLADTIGRGGNRSADRRTNIGTNLNFLHRFSNTGRELSGDLNFLNYSTSSRQDLLNRLYLPDEVLVGEETFLYQLPSSINIYTAKADYVHPFKNKARVEGGFKTSVVDQMNPANYYTVKGGSAEIDNQRSNHFRYHENINAAYINSQKAWKRFSAQLGLRMENTEAWGRQDGNAQTAGSRFTKSYTDWFPSLFAAYKLDTLNKNSLSFSLTRRINRPNYQQLNPFLFFRDNYSYYAGNPLLTPQFQYRYELRFQHKQFLRMALSYNRFTHILFQTTEAVDDIFITKPQNIRAGHMLLLNTGLTFYITRWWNLNSDILLSHIGLNGQAYTEKLNPNAYIARINVINQFPVTKTLNAELNAYFASADLSGQTKTGAMYRVGGGVQKKFWKDKASIRLSFEDLFHSWIYHNRSISLRQASYEQVTTSDTRRFGMAFTYRFGKEELARKRRHVNNASDDEKGRVD